MNTKQKLKIAILCAALAGVTVACTPNHVMRVSGTGNSSNQDAPVEKDTSRVDGMAITASQLSQIAETNAECDRTDGIIASAQAGTLILGLSDEMDMAAGAVALVNAIDEESNIDCKMDAMAQVAERLMKSKVNPVHQKSVEDEDKDFADVDIFLAKIQPTFTSVSDRIEQRDMVSAQVDAEQMTYDKTDEEIEKAEAILEKVSERIIKIYGDVDGAAEVVKLQKLQGDAEAILNDVNADDRRSGVNAAANLKVMQNLVAELTQKAIWAHDLRKASSGITYDSSQNAQVDAVASDAPANSGPQDTTGIRKAATGDVSSANTDGAAVKPSSNGLRKAATGITK